MGGALSLQFNMKSKSPFTTICLTSILFINGLLPCLSAVTDPLVSDTNNSAIRLESRTDSAQTNEPIKTSSTESVLLPETVKNDRSASVTSPPAGIKTVNPVNDSQVLGPISLRRVVPISLESTVNSKLVKIGDNVTARLKENLYYGRQLIAPANSTLIGHVLSIRNSRTLSEASFNGEDRFKSDAALEIVFENICINENCTIPITGKPAHQEATRTTVDGLAYGVTVDRNGKIVQGGRTLTSNQKNTYNSLRVLTVVPLPGGWIANFGGAPVVMATVGAISPDIVFNRPIDHSVSHRRLKGMGYGFVTNLPGAFFVQSVVEKGNEIILSKGDELMIDITISNQLIHQNSPPVKRPEALVVKAELLEDLIPTQNNSQLPLKPQIDSITEDDHSSNPTDEKSEAIQAVISSLESQNSE